MKVGIYISLIQQLEVLGVGLKLRTMKKIVRLRIFEIVQHGDEERTNHVRVVFRHIVIHEAVMVYVTGLACMGTFNGFMCGRILDLESSMNVPPERAVFHKLENFNRQDKGRFDIIVHHPKPF